MPLNTLYGEQRDHSRPTHCKVVATLGPASEPEPMLEKLIHAGVNVFRLNFSHGSKEDQLARLQAVRKVASAMDESIGVLGDLQGPKMRTTKVPDLDQPKGIMLKTGEDVVFRKGVDEAFREGDKVILGATFDELYTDVEPGQRVLVNDGAIRMLAVDRKKGEELRCSVTHGGIISSGKGINLPESDLSVPAITPRDLSWVEWAVENEIDMFALSFVRQAAEVETLREHLTKLCTAKYGADAGRLLLTPPIIAKIEKPQAIVNLDEIVHAVDGVMVARGDLGVEMDVYHVPTAQKVIIEKAAAYGKPVIVATQMLETMTEEPYPTRAEASDVANAVFDGADAVMLSGETAVGKHPDLVVETMKRIIRASEDRIDALPHDPKPPANLPELPFRSAALATGAWHVAKRAGAKLVVVWSETGGMARYLSQHDFRVPIIACSTSEVACQRMALFGGVTPVHSNIPDGGLLAKWTDDVEMFLTEHGWASDGDAAVLIAGKPLGGTNSQDIMAILRIGDPESGFRTVAG